LRGIGRVIGVGVTDTLAKSARAADTPGTPSAAHVAIALQRSRDLRTCGIVTNADRLHHSRLRGPVPLVQPGFHSSGRSEQRAMTIAMAAIIPPRSVPMA